VQILLIAPPHARVTRTAAGPGGQVAMLAESLTRRGHRVTVCTSEPSDVEARVRRYKLPEPEEDGRSVNGAKLYALRAIAAAPGHDVIHSFAGPEVAVLAAGETRVPVLATLWDLPSGSDRLLWRGYEGAYTTTTWAQAMRAPDLLPHASFAGVVYPPIDVDAMPYAPEKESYLVTFGPVGPASGTDLAIAAARKAEQPLIIAGPVAPGAVAYFEHEIRPKLDGTLVRYLATASTHQRRQLLHKARALLLTARATRPWDLAAAEAMAMGTPVIALDRGGIRELVVHAETGFVADDLPGLVSGIDRLDTIEPVACRRRAERCWDIKQAASSYEAIYESLAGNAAPLVCHPELEALDPRTPLAV
jgi:glycosyltransferase involved in cell wall biosynthesis